VKWPQKDLDIFVEVTLVGDWLGGFMVCFDVVFIFYEFCKVGIKEYVIFLGGVVEGVLGYVRVDYFSAFVE
jgi:hypothetical protein